MKYVIEIEDEPFGRNDDHNIPHGMDELYRAKGFNSLVFDQFGLDKLTPLDKELEEAYQRGLEEGKKQAKVQAHLDVCHDIERVAHGNYQKGLDDAWECARKIVTWPDRSLVNSDTFDLDPGENIFTKYSASRAIEKLKAYEEQQKQNKRIMFCDGLVTKTGGINGIALSNEVNRCVYVWREDCVAYEASVDEWKKTGKTYSQLAELLKAMKGEQRNCSTCKHQLVNSIECVDCCGYEKWEPKEGAE